MALLLVERARARARPSHSLVSFARLLACSRSVWSKQRAAAAAAAIAAANCVSQPPAVANKQAQTVFFSSKTAAVKKTRARAHAENDGREIKLTSATAYIVSFFVRARALLSHCNRIKRRRVT